MRYFLVLIFLTLTACPGRVVIQDRVQSVSVPVTVPCVAGDRPEPPESLKSKVVDWYEKTFKQKVEIFGAQALRVKNYGEDLNAATSACK